MNRAVRLFVALLLTGGFWSAVVGSVLFLLPPGTIAAQVPEPSKTPIDPTEVTPTDTSAPPTPTDTSAPPTPTDTSAPPTPTDTPAPPTPTDTSAPPTPTDTPAPPTPTSTPGSPAQTPQKPKPDPACQSAVAGVVRNAANHPVAGASVQIQGTGFSGGMLTDDQGRFGFSSLCAGQVTLSATLPGGQLLPSTTVSLDGQNQTQVDLGGAAAAATVTPPAKSPTPTAKPASTDEPGMPATGFPGWLLVGVACLGSFLVLSIRTLRAIRSRSRE